MQASKQGPRPLVICGPSGSGKSTLLTKLRAELPDTFALCVSHTTRKPRPGERHGVEYHFVTAEEMRAAIDRGEFLESATFSGHHYGTSKQSVRNVQDEGKVCVLDIEIEGVKQICNTDLNPLLVFVLPPSIEELERRLRARKTETEESLKRRLDTAKGEIQYGECGEIEYVVLLRGFLILCPYILYTGTVEGNFHIVIPNRDLEQAYAALRDFVIGELQAQKNKGINVSLQLDYA